MASNKSASRQCSIDRVGVAWRKDQNKFVVEMRPPRSWWRLHFGSFATESEAMIARDFGAYIRDSAGEKGSSAGGFKVDHLSIYEFVESPIIFKSMTTSKHHCDEYKRLDTIYNQNPKQQPNQGGPSPFVKFCDDVRNDIATAIELFRDRYPHRLLQCRTSTEAEKPLQKVDGSLDAGIAFTPSSSNFQVRSSQRPQSSATADNKEEQYLTWLDEYTAGMLWIPPENSHSGIAQLHHASNSLGEKSGHVTSGLNANSNAPSLDGPLDVGMGPAPPSSNSQVGSSERSQISTMADKKGKGCMPEGLQSIPGDHEHPKESFQSGMGSFNHVRLFPGGKSSHVTRPVVANNGTPIFESGLQGTFPCVIGCTNSKKKESLLQVEFANYYGAPYHSGLDVSDDGLSMAENVCGPRSCDGFNTQLSSLDGGVSPSSSLWMSSTSISHSGAPGSLSAGTSFGDEIWLSSNTCSYDCLEMALVDEQFVEGEGVHIRSASLPHGGMGEVDDLVTNPVCEGNTGNSEQSMMLDEVQFFKDLFSSNDEDNLDDQTAMDIDEKVNVDMAGIQSSITFPRESDDFRKSGAASSHMLATAPDSNVEVMEKVVSKDVALNKVMSNAAANKVMVRAASNKVMVKAQMVEKKFKTSSSLYKSFCSYSAQKQALLAIEVKLKRVQLDSAVQQNNLLKIANLTMAKDNGVISKEKYIEKVNELLPN